MARALLADRGVIKIDGTDSSPFLHNLVTNSITQLVPDTARFAALLTPQGKIYSDFFIIQKEHGFFLDVPKSLKDDLIKKLSVYRLRSQVSITDESSLYDVIAGWDEPIDSVTGAEAIFIDPRLHELGWRALVNKAKTSDFSLANSFDEYQAHRVSLGVPEGGKDFVYGDAFPHEADMDQLSGIDFKKGCYIGQEVVSRMQHRGLARTRAVPVTFRDGYLPESGCTAEALGKHIGTIGSGAKGGNAIAILRLDRVEEAYSVGAELTAGGLVFSLETRPWIGFSVPRPK